MTPLVPPTMVVAVKLLDLSHLPQMWGEEMMENKSSLDIDLSDIDF